MTAVAGGDARCGIGTRLRSAREKKALTILQAAEKLHVDPKVLESLEAEDFAALGAPVYVRGHLRHYAELVGEPASELQQIYSDTIRTEQPDLTRVPKAQATEDPGRFMGPAIVVLLVFAVAGSVWWVLSLSNGAPPGHVVAVRVSQDAGVQATAVQGGSDAQAVSGSEGSGGIGSAGGSAHSPGAAPGSGSSASTCAGAQGKAPAMRAGSARSSAGGTPSAAAGAGVARGPGSSAVQAGTGAGAAGSSASNAAAGNSGSAAGTGPGGTGAVAPPVAKPAEVTLKFSADSWAEVYDAGGERLFYDIGAADSVHTVKGTPPLRILLGNAPGVTLEVNGRAAVLGPLVQPDGSASLLINRSGRVVRAKPASNGG